jgi:hypothetical protein
LYGKTKEKVYITAGPEFGATLCGKRSKDPMSVIKSLNKIYLLKNVGIPEYYLGGNVEFLCDAWKNEGLGLAISARTYIQNVIPKFENLFGKELKPIKTPMSKGYHAEVDDTPLCTNEDSAKYRSIIGCCIWIIVLGKFDNTHLYVLRKIQPSIYQ